MVGSVRSALIAVGLAACGPTAPPSSPEPRPSTALGAMDWPIAESVPDPPGTVDWNDPSATIVIAQRGPPRGATLDRDAQSRLQKQLPKLKGAARLAALDALAETTDINSDDEFDGNDMEARLDATRVLYTSLIAEPGFATYAKADEVLYRAARIQFDRKDFDAGAALVNRLLSEYPSSAWISDVYVLIGNADADRDPAAARKFYDEAIASSRPAARGYARFQRLHVLDELGDYQAALADAVLLAPSEPLLRESVAFAVVHSYAEVGDPSDAAAVFGAMDREHLPTLLRRLATAYRTLGKLDAAIALLEEVRDTSTDLPEVCAAHSLILDVLDDRDDRKEIVREARILADLAHHTTEPRCRLSIDIALGSQATKRNDDTLWELAISVATTPERRAKELRNRAYLAWRLAHDRESWAAAATAFEAASAAGAKADPKLDAGAALARSNARALSHRH